VGGRRHDFLTHDEIVPRSYAITVPAVIEPQDSGASYEADAGANVAITGGKKIEAAHA
jgi:hypothetical protein